MSQRGTFKCYKCGEEGHGTKSCTVRARLLFFDPGVRARRPRRNSDILPPCRPRRTSGCPRTSAGLRRRCRSRRTARRRHPPEALRAPRAPRTHPGKPHPSYHAPRIRGHRQLQSPLPRRPENAAAAPAEGEVLDPAVSNAPRPKARAPKRPKLDVHHLLDPKLGLIRVFADFLPQFRAM